jgi:hypothetical protein
MIPKIIHQTFHSKRSIPPKIYENIKEYANEYEHRVYDDQDCIEFLKTYFSEEHANLFKELKLGAHKADLFRYCVLYIHGGVYLDIKTQLIQSIPEFEDALYLCIGIDKKHIYNGVMISPPGHPIFLKLIDHCLKNVEELSKFYHDNCSYFFQCIYHDLRVRFYSMKQSKFFGNEYPYHYIFYDEINTNLCGTKLDQYGLCTYIVDRPHSNFFCKVRYSDFRRREFLK